MHLGQIRWNNNITAAVFEKDGMVRIAGLGDFPAAHQSQRLLGSEIAAALREKGSANAIVMIFRLPQGEPEP